MDEIVREGAAFQRKISALPAGISRRNAMRGLAATLLATAGTGLATTQARNSKKHRRKHKHGNAGKGPTPSTSPLPPPTTPAVCVPGSRVASLAVPADGSAVFTPILAEGQTYRLRATGYWSTNGDYLNDAVAAFPFANPGAPVFFHNGVRLGLSVDAKLPDIWGTYQLSHEYALLLAGAGKPVSLRMLDSVYSDNARLLTVEVFCANGEEA